MISSSIAHLVCFSLRAAMLYSSMYSLALPNVIDKLAHSLRACIFATAFTFW